MTNFLLKRKLILIGGGGHAKVAWELAVACGFEVAGYLANHKNATLEVNYLGPDSEISNFDPIQYNLVLGIGSVKSVLFRKEIFERFSEFGFEFQTLIHPSSFISPSALIENGVQVFPMSIVHSFAKIGANVILNTGSCIEHDAVVGAHSHISPRALILGGVEVGICSHIGANSTTLQGLKIGDMCTVGAGAVVTRSIENNLTVVGMPAKKVSNLEGI